MKPIVRAVLAQGFGFARDRGGTIGILFAFALIGLCAAAALGVDYARATVMRQFLTVAADAAALAAVTGLPDADAARAIALEYVEKNMPSEKYGEVLISDDVTLGTWDETTRTFTPLGDQAAGAGASAVKVITRLAEERGNALGSLFAAVAGSDSLDLSATAIAAHGGPPCVLVLDPSAAPAALVGVTAQIETKGCGVQVNGTASPALLVTGAASIQTLDVCVSGTAVVDPTSSVEPEPREYCPGQGDPLAGLAPPSYGGCQHYGATYLLTSVTLSPGVYCGGLTIGAGADVTLSPGTYVVRDGPLLLALGAKLSGHGVTIYLTGPGAVVNFAVLASLDLSAPSSGSLAGILFFQDRDYSGLHLWAATAGASLKGVIYFPAGNLLSQSAASITPEDSCTVLIVNSLQFIANSGVSIDVSGAGCRNGLPGPYRRGIVRVQ